MQNAKIIHPFQLQVDDGRVSAVDAEEDAAAGFCSQASITKIIILTQRNRTLWSLGPIIWTESLKFHLKTQKVTKNFNTKNIVGYV